jgi:hypothetical protein
MKTRVIAGLLLLLSTGSNAQIWKAIKTATTPFDFERDGQKVACLRNGTTVAVGGWRVANGVQEVNNEVYTSTDKGVSWERQENAPWPAAHDFLFSSSVTGDTLVKWGGDGATLATGQSRRIDIYTPSGGWKNLLEDWGTGINDGHLLTGCRHKQYYYMLGVDNGVLSRFTLDNPIPEVVTTLSGEMAVQSGIMVSLPNGRLVYGAGLSTSEYNFSGKLWYSDDDGFTWSFLLQNDIFKNYWPAAVALKSSVIFWKGRDFTPPSGLKGVFYIPIENLMYGIHLDAWAPFSYTPGPRHAQGFCPVIDKFGKATDEAIGVTGNMYNNSWLFKRIDFTNQEVFLDSNCSFIVPDFRDNWQSTSESPIQYIQVPAPGMLLSSSHKRLNKVRIFAKFGADSIEVNSLFLMPKDTLKPTIPPLKDTVVYIGDTCSFVVPDFASHLSSSVNCGGTIFEQVPAAGQLISSSNGKIYEITITAKDESNNQAQAKVLVTVKDTTPPVVKPSGDILQANDNNQCSALAPVPAAVAYDNCSEVTLTGTRSDSLNLDAPFVVGTTTITWVAKDTNGNVATAYQKIQIEDKQPPSVNGTAAVSFCYDSTNVYTVPAIIASDICGIDSIRYTISGATSRQGSGKDASGTFNPGVSTITWTVTDVHGNTSTWQTAVRLAEPLRVTIPDAQIAPLGVDPNTVYRGYSASLTLEAHATGGIEPYSYNWSNGQTSESILLTDSIQAAAYTVTVTDSKGCQTSATATKNVKILDVRCGVKQDKVSICRWQGNKLVSLCVSQDDASSLLSDHCYLGNCVDNMGNLATNLTPQQILNKLQVVILPNPTSQFFTVKIQSLNEEPINIRVFNSMGVMVDQKENLQPGDTFRTGQSFTGGLYYMEVKQGQETLLFKLLKMKF